LSHRKIATGDFPKQLKLTDKTCAWVEQEIYDFIDRKSDNERVSSNVSNLLIASPN